MPKPRFSDLQVTCELLLATGEYDRIALMIEMALQHPYTQEQRQSLLEIMHRIPETNRLHSAVVARVYVRVLAGANQNAKILEFTHKALQIHSDEGAASLQHWRAHALFQMGMIGEIPSLLEQAAPHLSGELLGLVWGLRGLTAFALNTPWESAFQMARSILTGRALGLAMMNEAHCLNESGRGAESRALNLKALPHFHNDPYYLAWIRYNIGISALRDLDPEAERHFMIAVQLVHKPAAAGIQAMVFNGLALTRRMLGEWNRAETTYRQALQSAEGHERPQAYIGLARTLRLAGRISEALESLEQALNDPTVQPQLFWAEQAKVFMTLGYNEKAKPLLEHVEPSPLDSERWLEHIARAELARRDGQLDQAVQLLEGLPVHTLHAREEVRQWPQLFQLLEAAGKPVPLPLEYVQGTTVQVAALGVLRVTVNTRSVPIVPTGRVGELLVFLLEHAGAASLEVISEALYPKATHERARKSIWMLVKFLRDALGWEGSVIALRAAYQLDPNITWEYDVREARSHGTARGGVQGDFLAGVYSDWALEVGHELEGLLEMSGHRRELN